MWSCGLQGTFSSVCSTAAIRISPIINYHNQTEKKATAKIGELMLNHRLMKNLKFFLCSQADFVGFFRSFSGAGSSFTSYIRVCFYAVSMFLCCVNLWTLPTHFCFIPCAFLEEKMPLQYLYDCQTVKKGDTDWGPG